MSFPKAKLKEETVKLAKKMMEKSPAVVRYTKEALRAVRFMNEPQAADYLAAKSDALRFNDKEDSRTQGHEAVPRREDLSSGARRLQATEAGVIEPDCVRASEASHR